MNDFNYSGYPLRDSTPYGYSFVQYVNIFRETGGYGSLVPREPATAPAADTGGDGADKPGTRVAKGATKLSMPGNGRALGHVLSNGNGRETGEFDAIEGSAQAELKWRDTPQR